MNKARVRARRGSHASPRSGPFVYRTHACAPREESLSSSGSYSALFHARPKWACAFSPRVHVTAVYARRGFVRLYAGLSSFRI